MDKIKGIKIKYSSPAAPPEGIKLNAIYIIGFDNKIYITDGNMVKHMELEIIQMLFNPVDSTWAELLQEPKEEKIVKKNK